MTKFGLVGAAALFLLMVTPAMAMYSHHHHYGYMNALKFHYGSTYASSYGFYPRYWFYARSDFDRRNTFN
jgi:hypothetical protein